MSVSPEASRSPWLSLVGIGADGIEGLSPRARSAIEGASTVFGSARQLGLVSSLVHGESLAWPSPLTDGIAKVLARRGKATCVLASGDPFFFGIGATLSKDVPPGELTCLPAPSSLSLAAARLGWALQDVDVVSLHGRELASVLRYLRPGRRVFALSWDKQTPARLSQLLIDRGFGETSLHLLERLGAADERVRSTRAKAFSWDDVDDLNLVGLDVRARPSALVVPCRGSLPDSAFEHDGQLTKQDIRALTMSALAPRPGELLWDIGAGAGSIAIEWMLSHPTCRAIAIEEDPTRVERITRNARFLGVPELEIKCDKAPHGLDPLPSPDAVFIGGGGADKDVFTRAHRALRPGGRLVMNTVALETEQCMLAWFFEHGGELRRFTVEAAQKLGNMTTFRPALSVTQWRLIKP